MFWHFILTLKPKFRIIFADPIQQLKLSFKNQIFESNPTQWNVADIDTSMRKNDGRKC